MLNEIQVLNLLAEEKGGKQVFFDPAARLGSLYVLTLTL